MPKDLFKGIHSTMFDTPSNYKESSNYYKSQLQQKINDTWEYASDNFEIEEEIIPGTLEFKKTVCRINHAINPTTGLNRGDDWKELKFFDLDKTRMVGERFQFDNSVWITVNTDDAKYITKSSRVRRCNNVLRWIDLKNGKIITEPCIVEYAVKYANVYFNDTQDVLQGTISAICQNNEFSYKININDRFILGKHVYKVKTINDYLRNYTYEKNSNPLITLELYIDAEAPDDDFDLQIANMDKYKDIYPPIIPNPSVSEIKITPNVDFILQTQTVNYECYLYEDGKKKEDVFSFTASGPPTNYYILNQMDGNKFSITNLMRSKTPLVISCVSDKLSTDFSITLKGVY